MIEIRIHEVLDEVLRGYVMQPERMPDRLVDAIVAIAEGNAEFQVTCEYVWLVASPFVPRMAGENMEVLHQAIDLVMLAKLHKARGGRR